MANSINRRIDDFRANVDIRFSEQKEEMNRHFDEVDRRFSKVDRRFAEMDRRFDKEFGRLDKSIGEMRTGLTLTLTHLPFASPARVCETEL